MTALAGQRLAEGAVSFASIFFASNPVRAMQVQVS
jgi:hypothetical protein